MTKNGKRGREETGAGYVATELVAFALGAAVLWFIAIGPAIDAFRDHPAHDLPDRARMYDTPDPTVTNENQDWENAWEPSGESAGPGGIQELAEPHWNAGATRSWSCGYSPTMNDDWHDDVLCSNGTESDRPYLLLNDSFITEAEIMRAAAEYEDRLNS